MATTWEELTHALEPLTAVVDAVQIDVMDGVFVPSCSFPYRVTDGELTVADVPTLPAADTVLYEIHLMVQNPAVVAEHFVAAGARRIIFHVESFATPEEAIDFAATLRQQDVAVGVSLMLDTSIESVVPLIESGHIESVQVMSIAEIGYQGHAFDERALDRIRTLTEQYPQLTIAADGGITETILPELMRVGVQRVGIGSAIMQANDPVASYEHLARAAATV